MRALASLAGGGAPGVTWPATGAWYSLRFFCVRLLLAMALPLLYSTDTASPPGVCPFFDCLLHDRGGAPGTPSPLAGLLGQLFQAFAEGPRPPRGTPLPPAPRAGPGAPGRPTGEAPVKPRVASSVLGLPSWALRAVVGQTRQLALGAPEGWGPSPLGDASALLALVLLHYTPQGQALPRQLRAGVAQPVGHNPAKETLGQAQDVSLVGEFGPPRGGAAAGAGAGLLSAPPPGEEPPLALDFAQLYLRLGEDLGSPSAGGREQATLLLYSLLHECPAFRHWVSLRSDGDALVLPLLRALYEADKGRPRQSYVILTVLLMLTQDPGFAADVQALGVRKAAFYRECPLAGVTMGTLVVAVLVRAVRRNLAGGMDLYMHTNCLATAGEPGSPPAGPVGLRLPAALLALRVLVPGVPEAPGGGHRGHALRGGSEERGHLRRLPADLAGGVQRPHPAAAHLEPPLRVRAAARAAGLRTAAGPASVPAPDGEREHRPRLLQPAAGRAHLVRRGHDLGGHAARRGGGVQHLAHEGPAGDSGPALHVRAGGQRAGFLRAVRLEAVDRAGGAASGPRPRNPSGPGPRPRGGA